MRADIYVLGTGLSHDGSAVLLKNGQVCVAIEKERLSRKKHDGGNDTLAIQYCLDAEGIQLEEVSLVVQCANFEIPDRELFRGERIFAGKDKPELVNISHHLAHAYSAVGTAPFDEGMVMVIDGCGSPLDQFLQLHPEQKALISDAQLSEVHMQCEKDSFYHFDGKKLKPLRKDFSKMAPHDKDVLSLPTTAHSIGGFYAAISHYVFGDMDDVGKLMGLAPFGESGIYEAEAFVFDGDSLMVNESWKDQFNNPSKSYSHFKTHFTYYANVAKWAQEQVEKAVIKCIRLRLEKFPHKNLYYSGGVALNAAANRKLIEEGLLENIYFEPAAADNGLALGCAFYGWLEHMNKTKLPHNGSTCFGKNYDDTEIATAIKKNTRGNYTETYFANEDEMLTTVAKQLSFGKTVAWFHSGAEFGPRSLGRRSILAHPGIEKLKDHINANIKFREDFRPFAPAILKDQAANYFESGRNSPYMILLDKTRQEKLDLLKNVTHCDGTARVQTVDASWNEKFSKLLSEFHRQTGIPVLLNTSLNKKGMPMVETPKDALDLFDETALDILVLENRLLEKKKLIDKSETLDQVIQFLNEIGITVIEETLDDDCLLSGLKIQENSIRLDRERLEHPGDILHEAGHLAVTPEDQRAFIGTEKMDPDWPQEGDEVTAILWSYAAVSHLNIDPEFVFHPSGYKGDSQWFIEQFHKGNYIGLPLLKWMGFVEENASGESTFPMMSKWLR